MVKKLALPWHVVVLLLVSSLAAKSSLVAKLSSKAMVIINPEGLNQVGESLAKLEDLMEAMQVTKTEMLHSLWNFFTIHFCWQSF